MGEDGPGTGPGRLVVGSGSWHICGKDLGKDLGAQKLVFSAKGLAVPCEPAYYDYDLVMLSPTMDLEL